MNRKTNAALDSRRWQRDPETERELLELRDAGDVPPSGPHRHPDTRPDSGFQPTPESGPLPIPDPDPDPEEEKSTAAGASVPLYRERDIATHGQLCVVYADVLKSERDSTDPDRLEASKTRLAKEKLTYLPNELHAAIRAVEHKESLISVAGAPRRGTWTQVAAPTRKLA